MSYTKRFHVTVSRICHEPICHAESGKPPSSLTLSTLFLSLGCCDGPIPVSIDLWRTCVLYPFGTLALLLLFTTKSDNVCVLFDCDLVKPSL